MVPASPPRTCDLPGQMRVKVLLEARDADGVLTGTREKEYDLITGQFAQFTQALILALTVNITDTGGTPRSVAAGSTNSAPTILAGTGSTAAAVTDTALGTQTESTAATVNAYSGSGTSGTYTCTGTVTAGSARAYTEVGLGCTNAAHTFLLCRDVFSVLNVSSGGTLAVTYSISNS